MGHPWMPNYSESIISRMLERIGASSIEELYRDIPEEVRFRGDWAELKVGFGGPLSELEVSRHLEEVMSRNSKPRIPPFMGGGVWPHYIPAAVKHIVYRGEFLTSYTPYQAEINQGLLQALFEYQSLMAELLEMDVVNCSHYDWGSSIGEAFLMSMRVNGGKRFLAAETMNPLHRRVAETYLWPHGGTIESVEVDRETGYIDLESLESRLGDDVSAVYVEYPHYTGVVDEGLESIGEAAHRRGALFIVGVEPISMALLKPPGRLGADIVVGEGQPLGIPLSYGGPYLGIFAVRWDARLVRQMPGRIVGLTEGSRGERGFALVLQTREQHIRRSRATSNITTNEALMAIAAASFLALYGREGLVELAEHIWYKSHYASKLLSQVRGVEAPLLKGEFIMDFTVRLPARASKVREELGRRGILAGIPLGGLSFFTERDLLLTVTEVHSEEDIEALVNGLESVLGVPGLV